MNQLSWLIYFADVSGGLAILLGISAAVLCIGGAMALIISLVEGSGGPAIYSFDKDPEAKRTAHKALHTATRLWAKRALFAGAGSALIATFIPSQGTIYAIAASEIGEDVLKSETGSKAVRALNAWLDRQIAGEGQRK